MPHTTDSDHDEPIAPNRIAARPAPTGCDRVWVSDLTAEGWLKTAVVLDRVNHRVIGSRLRDHRTLLEAAGIPLSMSRSGNPYDNAAMESWMATYKCECVVLAEAAGGYATRANAKTDFFDYVESYDNRVRRHSALGFTCPVDFENQLN